MTEQNMGCSQGRVAAKVDLDGGGKPSQVKSRDPLPDI